MSTMIESGIESLTELRAEIDHIDEQLVQLLVERCHVAEQIGHAKREVGISLYDPAREAKVVRRAGEIARDANIDPEAVRHIMWLVVRMTRYVQKVNS